MEAAYRLQTQVIYCHKAGEGVRPEAVAKAGFGAGIGSGGTPLANAGGFDMEAMGGMSAGMPGGGLNAQAMRAMAMGGGCDAGHECYDAHGDERPRRVSRMAPPPQSDDVIYLCVADVLVTEQAKKRSAAHLQDAVSRPCSAKTPEH
ncbi:MAG: complement resistance protein TraT [Nitrospiraceae bacterium]